LPNSGLLALRSVAWSPIKVMKSAYCPAAALHGSVGLPFIIPSISIACGKLREK
jgi:hypothetical protein